MDTEGKIRQCGHQVQNPKIHILFNNNLFENVAQLKVLF